MTPAAWWKHSNLKFHEDKIPLKVLWSEEDTSTFHQTTLRTRSLCVKFQRWHEDVEWNKKPQEHQRKLIIKQKHYFHWLQSTRDNAKTWGQIDEGHETGHIVTSKHVEAFLQVTLSTKTMFVRLKSFAGIKVRSHSIAHIHLVFLLRRPRHQVSLTTRWGPNEA